MIHLSQLEMLHRHGEEWAQLEEVDDTSPDELDIERRLGRGAKLYKCAECDLEILVVPPDETG